MTYIKESIITKLQKLYSPPRNLRAANKSPMLFLKKRSCKSNLSPAHKIFIERLPHVFNSSDRTILHGESHEIFTSLFPSNTISPYFTIEPLPSP